MHAPTLACLLLAAVAAGCGEPAAPSPFAGSFTLREIESDPVPAVWVTNEFVTVRLLADTLMMIVTGRGVRITQQEVQSLGDTTAPRPVRIETGFAFQVVGDRIELTLDCPPGALCIAPPHFVGRLTPDGVRMDYALGGRVPLVYRRFSTLD